MQNKENKIYDIIIVGAGAAGMTCALYALRAKKKVLLIENESIGGQIATSPKVENFPSIKSISGEEFSSNLFEQIEDLNVDFEFDSVKKIIKENELFIVYGEEETYYSKVCVIATGAKHKKINVLDEDLLIGKGVSYCAVCDGAFYKGQDVCVIGDGNTSLQYSILLSNYCKKVYICTLFDRFFAEKSLIEIVKNKENIEILNNLELKEFIHNKYLTGLKFNDKLNNKIVNLNVQACFIAIGQKPNNEFLKNLLDLNELGYIIVDENFLTKTKNLYAIGDCINKKIRQLTTAINDGTIAAINACNELDKMQ